MQEKNRVTLNYFEDKNRFADLLNGYIFHGEAVVNADDIHERKQEIQILREKETGWEYTILTRDVVKEVDIEMSVVLVSLENQSGVHYAMPVRVMAADGGFYYNQWKQIAAEHRENKDLKGNEFLSGIFGNTWRIIRCFCWK